MTTFMNVSNVMTETIYKEIETSLINENLEKSKKICDGNCVEWDNFKIRLEQVILEEDYDSDFCLNKLPSIFTKSIGLIDPSIILCKLNKPQLSILLVNYLVELHKQGHANAQHTELLFNLFHLKETRFILEEFIQFLQSSIEKKHETVNHRAFYLWQSRKLPDNSEAIHFLDNFCVEKAIDVLIENEMMDEALQIAGMMNCMKHIILIHIKCNNYQEALNFIRKVNNHIERKELLLEYGPFFLCKPQDSINDEIISIASDIYLNENSNHTLDFINLFSLNIASFQKFIQIIVDRKPSSILLNILIPLLITNIAKSHNRSPVSKICDQLNPLYYIQNEIYYELYDKEYILMTCFENDMIEESTFILEKLGRYEELITLLIKKQQHILLKNICETYFNHEIETSNYINKSMSDISGYYWGNIFEFFTKTFFHQDKEIETFMRNIINKVLETNPLPYIVGVLSKNPNISVDLIKPYLMDMFSSLQKDINNVKENQKILTSQLNELDKDIYSMETSAIAFKRSTCTRCQEKITAEYSSISFMCGHTFHSHCLKRDKSELYCLVCGPCESPDIEINEDANINLDLPDLLNDIVSNIHILDQNC
ncbi:hypothetical protein TRFO_33769 [Tritrichomonas foetus]|uniref:RING-type domain-containing protein n=1 Tax=Tritrichomonas foetus TaxID=1144522 RepID=A0A1J4JR49_9EUKA|nr:hypothetical protein TRFO_33769 [Tritrichomonas foetus]|eukprot:OHS99740.1 hypothetical protein TRFO_33769 [Tritrichomonas foetus]